MNRPRCASGQFYEEAFAWQKNFEYARKISFLREGLARSLGTTKTSLAGLENRVRRWEDTRGQRRLRNWTLGPSRFEKGPDPRLIENRCGAAPVGTNESRGLFERGILHIGIRHGTFLAVQPFHALVRRRLAKRRGEKRAQAMNRLFDRIAVARNGQRRVGSKVDQDSRRHPKRGRRMTCRPNQAIPIVTARNLLSGPAFPVAAGVDRLRDAVRRDDAPARVPRDRHAHRDRAVRRHFRGGNHRVVWNRRRQFGRSPGRRSLFRHAP